MSGTQAPLPAHGYSSFRRVLQQFKYEHLNASECEQFQFTELKDLKSSMKEIQDEQASKSRMRNMNRLRKFLEGMEQYEKLIEVFLNASEFVAFVWGPMKFLLQVTRNHVRAFDALLDYYEDMGDQLEVLAHHQSFFESKENKHLNAVLEMIFRDILEFHAKALSYFRQKRWRTLFDITWSTFRTRFSEPMNSLKRHTKLLEEYTRLTTLERISALSDDQAQALKLQTLEARRQQRDRVRSWLLPEDMVADQEHYTATRRAYPGTGDWVLRRNLVMDWLDHSSSVNPILWLTSIPGAGKTMLASTIIEAASKQHDSKVAFVYCKDGNPNRDNFLSIARNLLYQLSHNDDRLAEYIDAIMSKEGQMKLQRTELAKELLRVVVRSHDSVFIVIDGFDECLKQDKRSIFQWVQSIISSDPMPHGGQQGSADQGEDSEPALVRCLIVGQEDGDTSRLLRGYPVLKILPADNAADIITYCKVWESKIRTKFPSVKFDDVLDSISTRVLKCADGMFQFARLVMTNLHYQSRAFRLQEELKWLSEANENLGVLGKLEEAYRRILRSMRRDMDDEKYRDATQILSWVTIAQRNLRWHEIQGAISLDIENRVVDFEGRRFSDEDGPKDFCGSLLEVTKDGTIMLVHSTAKLFLTKHFVNVVAEHLNLAALCLSYLSVDHVDISLSSEAVENNIMKGCYAFFDYAASHWLDHLTKTMVSNPTTSDRCSLERLSIEIRRFLGRHFQNVSAKNIPPSFIQGFNPRPLFGPQDFLDKLTQVAYLWSLHFSKRSNKPKEKVSGKNEQCIEPASGLGAFIPQLRSCLDSAAQKLKGTTGLKQLQQYHGTGLFKCRFIHCDYFHLGFTEKLARDSHQNRHERSFVCVFGGCPHGITGFASFRSLENHIRDAHSTGTDSDVLAPEFPLLGDPKSIDVKEAARSGNLAAVRRWAEQFNGPIPLESFGVRKERNGGVHISTPRSAFNPHLIHCVWDGMHFHILKYLVEYSEDIELAKIASLKYSFTVSRWPDAEEWIFSSPSKLADDKALYYTVSYNLPARDEAVCLRVLKHYHQSARVKPSGKISLLHLMAKHGFLSCVKFLVLDCGLDANYTWHGRTALMGAAERGGDAIVRFLLDGNHCTQKTVELFLKGKEKADAAYLAAANGHKSIVRALAGYLASDRLETLLSMAQLRQAAVEGDAEVVLRLVNSGIPIDVPDLEDYTPILHSVENNHKEVVMLLLDNSRGRISINRMCHCHHPGIAVPGRIGRTKQRFGATALIIACLGGYDDVVELLLKCSDIDTQVAAYHKWQHFKARGSTLVDYMNAFQIADRLGFKKIKRLLEEKKHGVSQDSPPNTEGADKSLVQVPPSEKAQGVQESEVEGEFEGTSESSDWE